MDTYSNHYTRIFLSVLHRITYFGNAQFRPVGRYLCMDRTNSLYHVLIIKAIITLIKSSMLIILLGPFAQNTLFFLQVLF